MVIPIQALSNGIITLRPYQSEDVKETYQAVRESLEDLRPWMNWAHPDYAIYETEAFITKVIQAWEEGTEYTFAITDAQDGRFIGGCGLNHFNPVYGFCNLGYWVRSSRRGHGYAAQAARLAASFGFQQLGLIRAEIVVAEGNNASLRVAEKAGARREGILRNRMTLGNQPVSAVMHSLIPSDFSTV